ncbi:hypothetical protein BH10ACT1_BH10ACT1_17990 [soil metagenome]
MSGQAKDRSNEIGRRPSGGRLRSAAAWRTLLVLGLLAAGLGVLPQTASAAGETLTVTLAQVTGTATFDGDDAPGHDSGGANGVVRTNDTVTYTAGIRYEGGDQTNPVISFTLPQGQELVSLPPFCIAGSSSVIPASLPAPTVPVTATSYLALPIQTVTCAVADQNQGTALDYKFVAKVRPEMPNANVMGPVQASATSDQVVTPAVSPTVSQTVSAAPLFDISKRMNGASDNSGPFFSFFNACSFDATQACRFAEYPLTISVPAGGKGISPLASPITFTDDLSPDVFYPAGTTSSAAWLAAGAGALDKYGARLTVCAGGPLNLHGFLPQPAGGTATSGFNAVRSSGTITCTQPGGPGTPVLFTITNADTTAFSVPTVANDGGAIPGNLSLVISTAVRVEIPVDAVNDLGVTSGTTVALQTHNAFTDIVANDITGQPNQGDVLANNVRDAVQRLETSDAGMTKSFVGITGRPGNAAACGFAGCAFEGLPGAGTIRDGNTVVVKGQDVISAITSERHNIPPLSGTTFSTSNIACDVWDDTQTGLLETFDYPGANYTFLTAPSGGSAAWMTYWTNGTNSGIDPAEVLNYKVEYSSTPTPGNLDGSRCDTGTWVDSPGAVAGAVAVDGVWQGVNRVRFTYTDQAAPASDYYQINFALAMRIVSDDATGTIIPNWMSRLTADGVKDTAAVLADPGLRRQRSGYDPATAQGPYGDRLILGQASVRINKFVKNPANGTFTDTAVPQYTAGQTVQFRLNPSLTADVAAGLFAPVIVEDCLPKYQQFVSSIRAVAGTAITPALVQQGAPVDSELVCAADQTYIRWDLGLNEIGKVIDPITYDVEILATVRNGNYINTTLVSSEADGSPAAVRRDTAQIQIVVPTGIKIAKSTPQNIVEVNPADIAAPRKLHWTVDFANIDSPTDISDVDVIDVLPADGLNGTSFTGTLAFESAVVSAGTGIDTLYTKQAPAQLKVDPTDPDGSNGPTGSTVWCSAATGGTVVSGNGSATDCPASAAEVTGLRFLRSGEFLPADELTVDITMVPADNAGGDVYNNRTAGRADGVTQPVGPAARQIAVIESSIGDYVWFDLDADGIQDDGEPPVSDFPVNLTGTDLDGNAVSLTTTTDAAGAYLFAGLASGTYTVTFDPAGLTAGRTFTLQVQGADTTVDSDGDATTGATGPGALAPDAADLDLDQGIILATSSITLSKEIVDPAPFDEDGDAASFPVTVDCTGPNGFDPISTDVTIARDGTPTVIDGLWVGSVCTVTETDTDGGTVTYTPALAVTITNGQTQAVIVTNSYSDLPRGSLSLTKTIIDPTTWDDLGDATTFDVTVACTGPGDAPGDSRNVTVDRDGTPTVLDDLYVGASCTVTETGTDGGTATYSPATPVIVPDGAGAAVTVEITNTFPAADTGSITVHKELIDPTPGDSSGDATTFPVTITCTGPAGAPDVTNQVILDRAGTPVTTDGLFVGSTCTLDETDTDGGTAVFIPASAIEITGGTAVAVTLVNTFPTVEQTTTTATTQPSTTTTAPPSISDDGIDSSGGGVLPRTGADIITWVLVGASLLLGGALLVRSRRRFART